MAHVNNLMDLFEKCIVHKLEKCSQMLPSISPKHKMPILKPLNRNNSVLRFNVSVTTRK